MEILTNLYPKVSDGGIVIIDDWGILECRRAVEDHLKKVGSKPKMVEFGRSNDACYFIKPPA